MGAISTTGIPPLGVYTTTNRKLTVQAEDATLGKAGEEKTIVGNDAHFTGETTQIVDCTGAAGGEAVRFTETFTAWN